MSSLKGQNSPFGYANWLCSGGGGKLGTWLWILKGGRNRNVHKFSECICRSSSHKIMSNCSERGATGTALNSITHPKNRRTADPEVLRSKDPPIRTVSFQ